MTKQVPLGSPHLVCPHNGKKCSTVCHKCPLWVQLRGTNPNSGEPVDQWMCATAALPMLLIENAQQSRQNGAATESMRNEIVRLAHTGRAARSTALIEGH